jgi:microcystin-dependent protein
MSNGFGWSWNRTLNGLFEFGFIWCDTIHARLGEFCPLLEVYDANCDKLWLYVNGDDRLHILYQDDGITNFIKIDGTSAGNYIEYINTNALTCAKIDLTANNTWTWYKSIAPNSFMIEFRVDTAIIAVQDQGYIYSPSGNPPTAIGQVLTWSGTFMDWQTPSAPPAPTPTHIIGEIFLWSSNVLPTAPAGEEYLQCDGASIIKANYTALDAIYSASTPPYPFGSTATNMNIPNLISRVPLQQGTIGSTGGSNSITITNAQLPAHTHGLNSDATSGGLATMAINGSHLHEVVYDAGGTREPPVINKVSAPFSGAVINLSITPGYYAMVLGDDPKTNLAGDHNHLMGGTTQLDGGGGAIDITNAYLSLNYVIRVK